MASKAFSFICGDDDYLLNEKGKGWYAEQTRDLADDLSKEIVDGRAGNYAEVEDAINRFTSAVQTLSLFGERKVVWLKDVNFLSDTVTGRAQGTLDLLENLKALLQSIASESVGVLITAQSVDKRRSFYKWVQKNSNFEAIAGGGKDAGEAVVALVLAQCEKHGVQMSRGAMQLLIGKLNGNSRLIVAEILKLATYVGDRDAAISEKLVNELVPTFGEAEFFEAADTFYTLRLGETLNALRRHFFTNKDSRGLLGSLQSRNRLLIQLRTLQDAGALRRGVSKADLAAAGQTFGRYFSEGGGKSNLNVFTQHPFYLSRLAETAAKVPLRKLIEFQVAFTDAFEAIIERPNEQEEVCRELAVKCLG